MAVGEKVSTKIKKRLSKLKDDRLTFDNYCQEVSDHALGRRDFTIAEVQQGRQRMTRIYDTTSFDANQLLGAALHSLLTNPQTEWVSVRYQRSELNGNGIAREYLEVVRKRLQTSFTRPDSGFASHISQVWHDLPGYGNGCMYVEEDLAFGARFVARPISEIWIDTDESGRIVAIYREFELEAWQAVEEYGKENLSEGVQRMAEKVSSSQKITFVQHVKKRAIPLPWKITAEGKPFESVTFEDKSGQTVREGGFTSMPFMFARWDVDTGDRYGKGPGLWALPNQKMLNRMWKTFIRGSEKAVDPPLLVDHDSVMPGSQLKVTPNSSIVIQQDAGINREPIRYLESRAQPNWVEGIMQSRAAIVQKQFHSEIIQAFMDPRMTATQVLELTHLAQRQLAPILGRMQQELLDPMIQRVYDIESRRMDFPQPPPELAGEALKFEYVGPIARAQKATEAQAILDTFAALQAISAMLPETMDNFDPDTAARALAESNGIPANVLRLRDEVDRIREKRAEDEAVERSRQEAQEGAETVAKLLPGVAALNQQVGGALPN